MKEAIQNLSKEISIVIYDAPLPPRYLRFSKKLLRFLFIVLPVGIGLILFVSIFFGFSSKVKEAPKSSFSSIVTSNDSKISDLESDLNALKLSNQQLQIKLSTVNSSDSNQDDLYLMNIKRPYGMQNLVAQNKVTLDQFEFVPSQDKINLKFQIISTTPENRVAGHILVFMISKMGILAYPAEANQSMSVGIKYAQGEPFAVSRLRPTNAEFSYRPNTDTIKFFIYIFSREGDLLSVKETEEYKLLEK